MGCWNATDLVANETAEAETEPPCIEHLKEELSQTCVMDDNNTVGALGFYIPLSNRCPRQG